MAFVKNFAKLILILSIAMLVNVFSNKVLAQDGKALFSQNCAACHAVNKKLTGPALAGVEDRWADKTKLHAWIHNSAAFLKTGDPYANNLYNEFNKTAMNLFPQLTDKEIDAILGYISTAAKAAAAAPAAGAGGDANAKTQESDNSLLFGLLTLVLAVIALVLLQVNSNLKKLADEKEGIRSPEPVVFWKNKSYLAFIAVILFLAGGYMTTKGAIGLGRSKDYQPVQPIYFSHKVHSGVNQINCQYCHIGVYLVDLEFICIDDDTYDIIGYIVSGIQ